MLILKKGTERNIILLTEMKPLQNLRGPRTGSLPWVLRPTETIWMPKRVLIRFSAAHLSSSISRSPQCTVAAAEDDDCGDYLQLTEGRKGIKCCSPAIATHITGASVEKAPQPHARGWGGGAGGRERAKCLCLTPCHATQVVPQRVLGQLTASQNIKRTVPLWDTH